MKRKRFSRQPASSALPQQILPSDLVEWDVTKVSLILTAASRGKKSSNRAANCEANLRVMSGNHVTLLRRFSEARKQYNEWLASTDILEMPVGSARYIIEALGKSSSRHLGNLLEKSIAVVQHHNEDCPNDCKDLVHCGQVLPDVSLVMLADLDASMSNFSRVTLTSMESIYTAAASLEDTSAGQPDFCDPSSFDPSSTPSTSKTFLSNIYTLPKFIAQDENHLIGDLLVDQYALGTPDMFGSQRVKFLSSDLTKLNRSVSFTRVLQHWCVSEHISLEAITRFLRLMHYYKPTIVLGDYDPRGAIPHTGRTLLSRSKRAQLDRSSRTGLSRQDYASSVFEENKCKAYNIFGPGFKTKDKVLTGRYVHFGLEKAILGTSIGLIHRFHYRNLLRRIHTVHPGLLPQEFLDMTKPESDEPFSRQLWYDWLTYKTPLVRQEQVVFEVRINADGAQWFESSYIKGTPILGKLVGVRTLSGSRRVKIPYHLAKPFVIGVFEQTGPKPPARKLLKDTIDEMNRLHPDGLLPEGDREGASFAVQVTCFDCDQPMRGDMKGCKVSGFYGCERCRTSGIFIERGNVPQVSKKTVEVTQTNADGQTTTTTKTKWLVRRRVPTLIGKGRNKMPSVQAANHEDVSEPQQQALVEEPLTNKRLIRHDSVNIPDVDEDEADSGRDASDEDGDDQDVGHAAIINSNKNTKKGRSAGVLLNQRHNLAVVGKRKKRKQQEAEEAEEAVSSADDDDDEGDKTDNTSASGSRSSNVGGLKGGATIETAAASSSKTSASSQKEPSKKRKIEGGSTYYPEIGALERNDKDWDNYRAPEIDTGPVSIPFWSNTYLRKCSIIHLNSNFNHVVLYPA